MCCNGRLIPFSQVLEFVLLQKVHRRYYPWRLRHPHVINRWIIFPLCVNPCVTIAPAVDDTTQNYRHVNEIIYFNYPCIYFSWQYLCLRKSLGNILESDQPDTHRSCFSLLEECVSQPAVCPQLNGSPCWPIYWPPAHGNCLLLYLEWDRPKLITIKSDRKVVGEGKDQKPVNLGLKCCCA